MANLNLHSNTNVALTLTDSATTPDFSAGNFFTLTLAGTDTLNNPSTPTVNQMGAIVIRQPAEGGKTLAFGTYYFFPGGIHPTISTAANALVAWSRMAVSSAVRMSFLRTIFLFYNRRNADCQESNVTTE